MAQRCYGNNFNEYNSGVFTPTQTAPNDNSTSYILDIKGLQVMDLDYSSSSYVCVNGTGLETCGEDYNRVLTVVKKKSSTAFAKYDSCSYNLELTGNTDVSMASDASSGYTTLFLSNQQHEISVPALTTEVYHPFPSFVEFGATSMAISQVKDTVSVDPYNYVEQVYPANGEKTIKKKTETTVTRKKIGLTITLSLAAFLFLVLAIVYCWLAKKENN